MTKRKSPILLLSYTFPPWPDVGGRRWAKFAKQLSRRGHPIQVIAATPFPGSASPWDADVESIPVRHFPRRYPACLFVTRPTFWGKASFKVASAVLKLMARGSVYDRALFWESFISKGIDAAMRKDGIRNIIATGAPFRIPYYAAKAKARFPQLNLISDIRDPWTWEPRYRKYPLPPSRARREAEMQRFVMEQANHILVPVEPMARFLKTEYPLLAKKIRVIPHGYDVDEIAPRPKTASERVRLVFYGNLYDDIQEAIEGLVEAFSRHKDRFFLEIFSDSKKYARIFEAAGVSSMFRYEPPLPARQLFERLSQYDYVLVIQPDRLKDNLSTRYYEIVYSRTPILLISNPGVAFDFVTSNRLGLACRPHEVGALLSSLAQREVALDFNRSFDVSAYSFEKLTDVVESLLV